MGGTWRALRGSALDWGSTSLEKTFFSIGRAPVEAAMDSNSRCSLDTFCSLELDAPILALQFSFLISTVLDDVGCSVIFYFYKLVFFFFLLGLAFHGPNWVRIWFSTRPDTNCFNKTQKIDWKTKKKNKAVHKSGGVIWIRV